MGTDSTSADPTSAPLLGNRHLPRRELIRLAGVGGLAVAAAGVAGARPLAALAASVHDATPDGFLAAAYGQRARAMAMGDTSLLDQLYDPSSSSLRAFEKERARFFHTGLGAASWWDGTILDYSATAALIGLQQSGSTATARLYEVTTIAWVPNPRPAPAAAALQRSQQRAPITTPRGPRGEITSQMGRHHEVTLVQGAGGWRLAKDAYDEFDLGFTSPDLVPGSWAEIPRDGGPTGIVAPPQAGTPAALLGRSRSQSSPGAMGAIAHPSRRLATQYTYYASAAVNYARTYATSRNGAYCDYSSCGGDCANFVSQSFRAGSQVNGGNWYTFSGGCGNCGTSSSNAGTDPWANNQQLHDFMLSAGRAAGESWITYCLAGDMINYYNSTNGWHHCTIITDDTNYLVCSHVPDVYNAPWNWGNFNGTNYWFIGLPYHYNA